MLVAFSSAPPGPPPHLPTSSILPLLQFDLSLYFFTPSILLLLQSDLSLDLCSRCRVERGRIDGVLSRRPAAGGGARRCDSRGVGPRGGRCTAPAGAAAAVERGAAWQGRMCEYVNT
eukprot:364613-Chlamydomonas_euryale.AAC.10